MLGWPRVTSDSRIALFYCSVGDRYLIRVPLEQLDDVHDTVVGFDELVDYRVPPDSLPILRQSTLACVHQALEQRAERAIPLVELRAWLDPGADRVFCAWGSGVATIGAQGIAELGLQKTGESPTIEAPE